MAYIPREKVALPPSTGRSTNGERTEESTDPADNKWHQSCVGTDQSSFGY